MHMPPPVHGAAMVGQWIHDSKIINEEFDTFYINPSVSNKVSDVGRVSLFKIWLFIKLLIRIIRAIIEFKPDLCYYTPTSDGWGIYRDALTISIMRLFRKKVVLHFHNKGVKNFSKRKAADIAYRIIFRNVKVILIAEQLYDDVSKYVDIKDVYFLPNGIPPTIDESQYDGIITARKANSHKNRLLYLSNMMSEKGIWILLDACKMLNENGKIFECHFVGNWGDTNSENFNNEIKERHLDGIVYVHGPQYGQNKNRFFRNSDIFVFPTYYHGECYPLVLLEAMEYGLPCISTPEGGIQSIINNLSNGILVEQKNVQQLYDAICLLIENKKLRNSMGENGRKTYIDIFKLDRFEETLSKMISIIK